jgi:disulfide bond formation protein DsbB
MQRGQRLLFLGVFLACTGLLGFALYLQEVKHLLPCPLCVVQRMAYWFAGLTGLLAFLHNPHAPGRRLYSGLIAVFALAGAAVALHHAWIIRHPDLGGCRFSPEEAFLNALPIAKWWAGMFEANGDCALVTWQFMSLAIPDWSLICFVLIAGLAVYIFVGGKRQH